METLEAAVVDLGDDKDVLRWVGFSGCAQSGHVLLLEYHETTGHYRN